MIIDVHVHYTQASPKLDAYRGWQVSRQNQPSKGALTISDDEIVQSLQGNLKQMRDRRIDRVAFSPRASGMGHDFGNELISRYWTEVNNDLIGRVCRLFPQSFVPVCQLPQSPGISPANCVDELKRCVTELGFVGCNINPDVSGGVAAVHPVDRQRVVVSALGEDGGTDVPGTVHASSTLNPALHVNGSHYVNQDTAAVVELCNSGVFDDFPTLKLIIPHAGGAVPFHFNRHRSLHVLERRQPFEELVRNLYFDLALYDQDCMELAIRKLGADRVMFATEMFGTGKAVDPKTGRGFDDTVDMVEDISWLSDADRKQIFEGTARKVFSRAKWD